MDKPTIVRYLVILAVVILYDGPIYITIGI